MAKICSKEMVGELRPGETIRCTEYNKYFTPEGKEINREEYEKLYQINLEEYEKSIESKEKDIWIYQIFKKEGKGLIDRILIKIARAILTFLGIISIYYLRFFRAMEDLGYLFSFILFVLGAVYVYLVILKVPHLALLLIAIPTTLGLFAYYVGGLDFPSVLGLIAYFSRELTFLVFILLFAFVILI